MKRIFHPSLIRHFCKSKKKQNKFSAIIMAVLIKLSMKVCSQSKFCVKNTPLKSLIQSALVINGILTMLIYIPADDK